MFLNRFFQRVVLLLNMNHRNQLTIWFSYSLIKSHLNHSWMNQCFWLNSRSELFNDSQYKNYYFLFSILRESGDWMIQLLSHRFFCFIPKLILWTYNLSEWFLWLTHKNSHVIYSWLHWFCWTNQFTWMIQLWEIVEYLNDWTVILNELSDLVTPSIKTTTFCSVF